jgi:hypothetical protein
MARAWTTRLPAYRLVHDAVEIASRAKSLSQRELSSPWSDDETDRFATFWFASDQRDALSRLAQAIRTSRYRSREILKIALSRVIITKDRGASLARDVSHSRPHRVRHENDFDVYSGFVRAARVIAKRLEPENIRGNATVTCGDARQLPTDIGHFDLAITSPPYLNAIDYLRGHRLTLIWLGYSVAELQKLRSQGTGAERAATSAAFDIARFVKPLGDRQLSERYLGWIRRYSTDITETLASLRTIVRPGGQIVVVVGNSLIRGSAVDNAGIICHSASELGLPLVRSTERTIPARRRYLPPPDEGSPFAMRMRAESVLTFVRP